jgi:hypothetical protein
MADTTATKRGRNNNTKHWQANKKAKRDSGEAKKKIDEGVAGVDYVQFTDDNDSEEPKKKLSNVAKKSGGFQKMGTLLSLSLPLPSSSPPPFPILQFPEIELRYEILIEI